MNSPRFYCREALSPGAHVELPEPVARHAVRVLRLPPGAPVVLFDGRGGEYPVHIERIERDRVYAELAAWQDIERESTLAVTLVQALQAGDKMDFTIQKAVELGVRDIVPVESRRSVLRLAGERAAKRVAHWQGVVASACEQCGRNRVPSSNSSAPMARSMSGFHGSSSRPWKMRSITGPATAPVSMWPQVRGMRQVRCSASASRMATSISSARPSTGSAARRPSSVHSGAGADAPGAEATMGMSVSLAMGAGLYFPFVFRT